MILLDTSVVSEPLRLAPDARVVEWTLFDTRRSLPRRFATVAATKWSFDVPRPIAIVVRAIANDPSGDVERTSWPR